MRRALESRPAGEPTGIADKMPAPINGWWASESIADAPKQTALYMINFFCEADSVRLRKGSIIHASGMPASVESLMVYRSGISREIYAASGSGIYDVTGTGAVGAPVVSGLTNSRWSYLNFGTGGTQYIRAVNGFDTPLVYDGTTWGTSPAITGTGLVPENLIHVWMHKRRLWFIEKNTTKGWYLDVDALGGTATEFDFGSQLKLGGKLIAGATWSVDAGDGLDDIFVVISSEGEVLVYAGDDPAVATSWNKVGTYSIGAPIGDRCFFAAGGDLVIIGKGGLLPISKIISLDEAVLSTEAVTRNIYSAYNSRVRQFGTIDGWQIETLPIENMAVLNIPTSTVASEQFALNTNTGAWAGPWVGINARCFVELDNVLYFGDPFGNVQIAERGATDNGAVIQGTLMFSYKDLGRPGYQKSMTMLRPVYICNTDVDVATAVFTDYEDVDSIFGGNSTGAAGGRWDVDFWDQARWAGISTFTNWLSATGDVGFTFAPAIRVNTVGGVNDELDFRLISMNYVYENADIVG